MRKTIALIRSNSTGEVVPVDCEIIAHTPEGLVVVRAFGTQEHEAFYPITDRSQIAFGEAYVPSVSTPVSRLLTFAFLVFALVVIAIVCFQTGYYVVAGILALFYPALTSFSKMSG